MADSDLERQLRAARGLLGNVAERYDLAGRVMTMGLHGAWRRQAIEVAMPQPGERVVDAFSARPELAVDLAARVAPGGEVIGIQMSDDDAAAARKRVDDPAQAVQFVVAVEGGRVPLPDASIDLVVSAFGMSRAGDPSMFLSEMARILRPGGRIVLLDVTTPPNGVAGTYMREVVPRLGGAIARLQGATFSPPGSFFKPEDVGRALQRVGLRRVKYRLLNVGTVALHWAVLPPANQ